MLSQSGYVFPGVAGTSAAAIVASLVDAHQVAVRGLSNLATVMDSVDFTKFIGSLADFDGAPWAV